MCSSDDLIVQFDDDSDTVYALTADGIKIGEMKYVNRQDYLDVYHTEIYSQFEGQGYAGKFAKALLGEIRSRSTKVFPRCPFLSGYIEKHEEFADLVF